MKLGRAKFEGRLLLGIGAGEDNHLHPHLGGKLNSQMSEPTDTDDSNAIPGSKARIVKGTPYCGTSTEQWTGIFGLDLRGNPEEGRHIPGHGSPKAALVPVGNAK